MATQNFKYIALYIIKPTNTKECNDRSVKNFESMKTLYDIKSIHTVPKATVPKEQQNSTDERSRVDLGGRGGVSWAFWG